VWYDKAMAGRHQMRALGRKNGDDGTADAVRAEAGEDTLELAESWAGKPLLIAEEHVSVGGLAQQLSVQLLAANAAPAADAMATEKK